jgi:hypothetical protein
MALLTTTQRAEVHGAVMRDEATPFGVLTKADIRAAVDALDVFFESNVSAINSAFPLPARTTLTTAQKSRLVQYVIQKRYG